MLFFSIFSITFSRFLVKSKISPLRRCDWGETATSFPDGSPMTVSWFGMRAWHRYYHPKIRISTLKRDNFKRKCHLPSIIFEGQAVSFRGSIFIIFLIGWARCFPSWWCCDWYHLLTQKQVDTLWGFGVLIFVGFNCERSCGSLLAAPWRNWNGSLPTSFVGP